MPKQKETPKGLDQRVVEILEHDGGHWFVEPYGAGFGRQRQTAPALPGYETLDAYDAHPRDIITWTWLDDIGLIDQEGRYVRSEAEKLRGIEILKEHLKAIAKRLGEI